MIHPVLGDKIVEDLGEARPAAHAPGNKNLEAAGALLPVPAIAVGGDKAEVVEGGERIVPPGAGKADLKFSREVP